MAKQIFEVRGLRFFVRTSSMAMAHACTFSIALRLPSRTYWIAYFKWQEGADPYHDRHVYGDATTVATGAGMLPSILPLDDEVYPKDVIKDASRATLTYVRENNSKITRIILDGAGATRPRTLRFNMVEPTAATQTERNQFTGLTTVRLQGKELQKMHSSPNEAPPNPIFNPY
jgi:hypothetical protein